MRWLHRMTNELNDYLYNYLENTPYSVFNIPVKTVLHG